jgi:hypothetical protein
MPQRLYAPGNQPLRRQDSSAPPFYFTSVTVHRSAVAAAIQKICDLHRQRLGGQRRSQDSKVKTRKANPDLLPGSGDSICELGCQQDLAPGQLLPQDILRKESVSLRCGNGLPSGTSTPRKSHRDVEDCAPSALVLPLGVAHRETHSRLGVPLYLFPISGLPQFTFDPLINGCGFTLEGPVKYVLPLLTPCRPLEASLRTVTVVSLSRDISSASGTQNSLPSTQ